MSISTESSSRTAPAIDWPTARSFVSGFLLRRLARPEPLGVERHALNGALLLSDVESFTAQVERLVSMGPEGLEEVISSFNRYFCAVADTVAHFGGDILDTTGDSFLCFWAAEDERELADATALAAEAALAVLHTTEDPSNTTIWPTRIGLAAGPVEVGIVGGVRSRWHVTPRGQAAADVVGCERDAAAGTVLVSADAAALLKHRALLRDTPDGRAELQRVLDPAQLPVRENPAPHDVPPERLDPMIPAPVRQWGGADHAWLADFRRVNVVMAHLGRADEDELLSLGAPARGAVRLPGGYSALRRRRQVRVRQQGHLAFRRLRAPAPRAPGQRRTRVAGCLGIRRKTQRHGADRRNRGQLGTRLLRRLRQRLPPRVQPLRRRRQPRLTS